MNLIAPPKSVRTVGDACSVGAALGRTTGVALDRELHRYLRVVTGYRETILYPVGYDES